MAQMSRLAGGESPNWRLVNVRIHLFRCPAHGVDDLVVRLGVVQL